LMNTGACAATKSGQETRQGVAALFNVDSKTLRRAMGREGVQ
jgi:hypothetical protein